MSFIRILFADAKSAMPNKCKVLGQVELGTTEGVCTTRGKCQSVLGHVDISPIQCPHHQICCLNIPILDV